MRIETICISKPIEILWKRDHVEIGKIGKLYKSITF
jgi:hypothetical protein